MYLCQLTYALANRIASNQYCKIIGSVWQQLLAVTPIKSRVNASHKSTNNCTLFLFTGSRTRTVILFICVNIFNNQTISTVLTEGNLRFRKCCCFNLSTGTNILAVLDILNSILGVSTLLIVYDEYATEDGIYIKNFKEGFPFPLNNVTVGVFTAYYILVGIMGAALLYGNMNRKIQAMRPWVYLSIFTLVLYLIAYFVRMIERFSSNEGGEAFQALVRAIVVPIVGLLFVQVVRCRIVEIEEMDRPAIPFTQVYPNAPPAYGQTKPEVE